MTLVSKRWRRLFVSTRDLWREFSVSIPDRLYYDRLKRPGWEEEREQWAAARAALLARVSPMIESLELNRCDDLELLGCGGELARLVRCLSPAVARSVSFSGTYSGIEVPRDAVTALAGLTRLTSLRLSGCKLPPHTATVLRQLSASLSALSLEDDELSAELAATLPLLPYLTCLHLSSVGPLPRFDWRRLTVLTQLQQLSLDREQANSEPDDEDEQLQPPPPAEFAALTDFRFDTEIGSFQVCVQGAGAGSLPLRHG